MSDQKPVLVEGDTVPSVLTYALAGVPVDITNYTITLKLGYNPPLQKVAVILDQAQAANKGKFRFDWAADDLKAGTWEHELLVTDAAGKNKTHKMGKLVIDRRLV